MLTVEIMGVGEAGVVEPTSGTVSITRLDSTVIDGNIDVVFGSAGHVTASFSAPVCIPSS